MPSIGRKRQTSSVEQQNSRYVQGGLSDRHDNRVGWWERREFERRDDDYKIIIRPEEEGRPDKISHRAYGENQFAWLVLQYNNIVDPAAEMTTGKQLVLPHQRRLILDILNQSIGGKPIRS